MTKWFIGLTLAALAVAPASAQDDAAAVVKKAVTAHGGADNLNKFKAGEYKAKGQLSLFGMDIDFTGAVAFQVPDKFRMSLDAEVAGQKLVILQVVNGKNVKTTVAGMEQKMSDAEKDEAVEAARLQEVSQPTPLLDATKYTIKAEKDDKVGDADAAVVLVSAKDLKDTRLYFDKKTGLLVKTERKGLAPTMTGESKEVTEETLMTDYKKVDGVMVAMKMTVNHDGKKFMTMSITEAKVQEKLDPKMFATDD